MQLLFRKVNVVSMEEVNTCTDSPFDPLTLPDSLCDLVPVDVCCIFHLHVVQPETHSYSFLMLEMLDGVEVRPVSLWRCFVLKQERQGSRALRDLHI